MSVFFWLGSLITFCDGFAVLCWLLCRLGKDRDWMTKRREGNAGENEHRTKHQRGLIGWMGGIHTSNHTQNTQITVVRTGRSELQALPNSMLIPVLHAHTTLYLITHITAYYTHFHSWHACCVIACLAFLIPLWFTILSFSWILRIYLTFFITSPIIIAIIIVIAVVQLFLHSSNWDTSGPGTVYVHGAGTETDLFFCSFASIKNLAGWSVGCALLVLA